MKILFIINILGETEPMGVMQLSSILIKSGHKTQLAVIEKNEVIKKIEEFNPDILAFSMMSVDYRIMMELNAEIRNKYNIFTIIGGPHATFDAQLIEKNGIDAVCVGEGDEALLDVVNALESNKDINDISNIITKSNRKPIVRDLYSDLDKLPLIDRDLLYRYTEMSRLPIKGIYTSRGCPFTCSYCFNDRYSGLYKKKGKYRRRRSVDSIIEEAKEVKNKYRVDMFRISDDVFVLKADFWLEEFAIRWSTEIKTPFYCLLRPEVITDKMAKLLNKAGCYSVHLAIEAGNDNLRRNLLKRNTSDQQIIRAYEICKKYKINTFSAAMLGLPYTDEREDIETLELMIKCKPKQPNFGIFMPYPGTALGDHCIKDKLVDLNENNEWYGTGVRSSLNCFNKKQKLFQSNLRYLGPFIVKFPILKSVILNYFINYRFTKLYQILHAIYAYFLLYKYIVVINVRKEDILNVLRVLRIKVKQSRKFSPKYNTAKNNNKQEANENRNKQKHCISQIE
ncbi:MAG: B12-binding domain-containing radical SAM protein [Candidatus Aureabacteria bacterium]|nr:B12-binding domain-containing radical SAM protein [Candidatus Auribacterota bacterium]